MKSTRTKQAFIITFEVIILVICFSVASLCVYFYINQFKQSELKNFEAINDEIVISNYISFKVEQNDMVQTVKIDGQIVIDDECVQQVELTESYLQTGQCFSATDIIGKQDGNDDYIAGCIGCVLSQMSGENKITLIYVNYNLIKLSFDFNAEESKMLDYNKNYDCLIGGYTVTIRLKNIIYDYQNGFTYSEFNIINNNLENNLYLFDNESCQLILAQKTLNMMSVDKGLENYMSVSEGLSCSVIIKDESGTFSNATIKIAIIGDNRIGIESSENIINKYICLT